MANISFNDSIFVSVMLRGTTLLNVRLTGFGSLRELMSHLHGCLRQYAGQLLTLEVRNSTKGWSRTDSMLLAA